MEPAGLVPLFRAPHSSCSVAEHHVALLSIRRQSDTPEITLSRLGQIALRFPVGALLILYS